jgi:NTE family protein
VDYVAGTSMGAIVGGLFAAGVPPETMEAWLRDADWDDLFRDRPDYSHLAFRRKQEARDYPIPLEVGIGSRGIQLPSGLVAGQKLNAVLRSMTFRVARVNDFDSLAVPFRAVATDLETGEMVVLGTGDLVDAMRASMSAPGVFTPYPVEDRLLVDGGLVRNLPVDVACAMGAEVVIAVDVGARLLDRSQLNSVVDLTMQVTRMMTRSGAAAQVAALGPEDVLLTPDVSDLGAASFGRALDALAAGEAAARAQAEELRRLAVDETTYREHRSRQVGVGDPAEWLEFVMIGAYSGRSPGSLLDRIATRPGAVDTVRLTRDIEHLYSLGIYERVDYRLVETDEGAALVLRVREKPWGPSYLRFRLNISDRVGGEGTYNLATHLLVPQLNDWGAELIGELQIGGVRRAAVELYQPLGIRGVVFVAPRVDFQSVPANAYIGELTVARYRVDASTLALRTGVHVGNDVELAVSLERGRIVADRAIGPQSLEGYEAETGLARFRAAFDGLDDPQFPRSGLALTVEAQAARDWLGATQPYHRLDGQLLGAVTRHRFTYFGTVMGTTSLETELPPWSRVGLGGFLMLSGYRPGEVFGNHGIFGRAMVYRDLGGGSAFAGVSLEAGNAWATRDEADLTDLRTSAALAVGFRTPLGPVYLGWGTRGSGSGYAYLEVGRSL